MRVDLHNPLRDHRVRQAIALTLDRPAIIKTLFNNLSDIGNDSPFAPVYPSTDKSVPQRKQDIEKAKALMQQAGVSNASATIDTWDGFELPDLSQLLQNYGQQIGLNLKPNVTPAGKLSVTDKLVAMDGPRLVTAIT